MKYFFSSSELSHQIQWITMIINVLCDTRSMLNVARQNPRDIGLAIFRFSFVLIGSLEWPPSI
jgi:hypothetical protein